MTAVIEVTTERVVPAARLSVLVDAQGRSGRLIRANKHAEDQALPTPSHN